MQDVIKQMGNPVSREEVNGLVSLVWENVLVGDYTTYMLAYFSRAGLQGGTYYFLTRDLDETMRCYTEMRQGFRDRYGETVLFNGILREPRTYECSWNLSGGFVYLKVNTRTGEPLTVWYSSPSLTQQIMGGNNSTTARR